MNYIDELLKGKAIRVIYNKFIEDYTEDGSGWMEELWTYDNELKMCRLFYPVSTYKKDFFTLHTMSEAESNLKNIDTDEMVLSVKIETNEACTTNIKSLKEEAYEIFMDLNEDQLRIFINKFR